MSAVPTLYISQPTSSSLSYKEQLAKISQDRDLLMTLQATIADHLNQVDAEEASVHCEFSTLMKVFDEGVRDTIVSYLDEEGLMELEKASMIKLEEGKQRMWWKQLWEARSHPFPIDFLAQELSGDNDDDGSTSASDTEEGTKEDADHNVAAKEDSDDDDTQQTPRTYFRILGTAYARASRMARCLEALAQTHYQTNFPVCTSDTLQQEWPTGHCQWRSHEGRNDTMFFVRLTYYYDDANQQSATPLVFEGFTKDIVKFGRNGQIMRFNDVPASVWGIDVP